MEVEWRTDVPAEENDYITTVRFPMMFGMNGASSYVRCTRVSHYSPEEGWIDPEYGNQEDVIAWTEVFIDPYSVKTND